MKLDAKAIGARIIEARVRKGLTDAAALADILATTTKGRTTVHKETVRLWETGKKIPPYAKVQQLAERLGVTEEWILFDIQRDGQVRDKRYLEYVSDEEMLLVSEFRRANATGQKQGLDHMTKMANDFPAPLATVRRITPRK